jgi:hypothetical protein
MSGNLKYDRYKLDPLGDMCRKNTSIAELNFTYKYLDKKSVQCDKMSSTIITKEGRDATKEELLAQAQIIVDNGLVKDPEKFLAHVNKKVEEGEWEMKAVEYEINVMKNLALGMTPEQAVEKGNDEVAWLNQDEWTSHEDAGLNSLMPGIIAEYVRKNYFDENAATAFYKYQCERWSGTSKWNFDKSLLRVHPVAITEKQGRDATEDELSQQAHDIMACDLVKDPEKFLESVKKYTEGGWRGQWANKILEYSFCAMKHLALGDSPEETVKAVNKEVAWFDDIDNDDASINSLVPGEVIEFVRNNYIDSAAANAFCAYESTRQ